MNFLNSKSLAVIAIFSAMIFAMQIVLSSIPNVEVVTLLFVIYSNFLDLKHNFLVAIIFVIAMGLFWGTGTWIIFYAIIWPLLVVLCHLLKLRTRSLLFTTVFIAFFSILFGIVASIEAIVFWGLDLGIAYYLRGLLFDFIHMFSNIIIFVLLYEPVVKTLKKNRFLQTSIH